MPQTDSNAVYKLGASGSLTDLPGIPFGQVVSVGTDYNAVIHTTLKGKRVRDVLGTKKRTWSFTWNFLLVSEADSIQTAAEITPLFFEDPFDLGEVEVILSRYSRDYVNPFEVNVTLELMEV